MRPLAGATAILTGANGGLGTHLTKALAAEGMHLLLVAFPGVGLAELRAAIQGFPGRSEILVADLRVAAERTRVIETALTYFGSIDLLINNAGVEFSSAYHELSLDRILEVLRVNLEAPMDLTRLVIPGMLDRKRGHIVNISSLAGKSGPGFQEPYAATKAALSAFTQSLRNTYRGTGVSASAVTPGFVEAGIYTRLKQQTGRNAPPFLGSCTPQRVCSAVVRAVLRDVPEITLSRYPIEPVLALTALFPRLGEWITERTGVNDFFRQAARAEMISDSVPLKASTCPSRSVQPTPHEIHPH
ncbi:MAG: SDR family NAD(P)-dependent oxidoreductase [Verrucomicrobiales bacterium]|nr:SDR family NAD(P)-dependent oxidoreductase [Verrucomicrobiales bacterium]